MTSSPPETLAARRIVTLDPHCPAATHAAVADGRIVAVGDAEAAAQWGYPVNDRYAGCVLTPGFVEAHGHLVSGGIWDFVYVGPHDRRDPDGRRVEGLRSNAAVAARLRAEGPARGPVIGWGFEPVFVDGPRLSRGDLDGVSADRPVAVLHLNLHLMTVNSAALALAGYGRDSDVVGLVKDADGEPTGELREFAAMFPVMRRLEIDFGDLGNSPRAMDRYARLAVHAGVTTITDLLNDLPESAVAMMREFTAGDDCPIRLVPALNALGGTREDIADRALDLAKTSTDRLRFGAAKVMTDGSIQGFTAQLKAPGYHRGTGDPIWNIAPQQLVRLADVLHARGVQMHIHTNGDLASEVAIDALERAVAAHPKWDHRHTLQHFQMADATQIRRLEAIGGAANLFANHVYYFGDQHHDITLGPQRAARINPCRTALTNGLPMAIHSDTPVTPLAPLFTAACAVNRTTESGRVLGAGECIAVDEALRAITLGAAWTLKLEHEVGSISPGKRADFAVLANDPLEVAPSDLGGIEVLGTVSGGTHFSA